MVHNLSFADMLLSDQDKGKSSQLCYGSALCRDFCIDTVNLLKGAQRV